MKPRNKLTSNSDHDKLTPFYIIFTLESLVFVFLALLSNLTKGLLFSGIVLLPLWCEWRLVRGEINLKLYSVSPVHLTKPVLIYIAKAIPLYLLRSSDSPELNLILWKMTFNAIILALVLLRVRESLVVGAVAAAGVVAMAWNAIRAFDLVIGVTQLCFCFATQISFAKCQEEVASYFMKRMKEILILLPIPLIILDDKSSITFKNEEAFEFFGRFDEVSRGSFETFSKSLLETNKSGITFHQNLAQFQKDTAAGLQSQMKWTQDYYLLTPHHQKQHTSYLNIKMLWSERLMLLSPSDKLLLVFTDTSAKEILKEQIALDNMKSMLIGTISHELRTPLNGIIGILYVVSEKLDAEVKEWWKATFASAQVLVNTVNCMVDLSCLETGQFKVHKGSLNIRELLDELMELADSVVLKGRVRLVKHVAEDVPLDFRTDPGRVRQILINLINNAVNYTYNGSISVSASMQDNKLKLEVKDTGIGLNKETQKCLAGVIEGRDDQPYFTMDSCVGLGLVISSRLARTLGGKMTFESAFEVGSCFAFTLQEFPNNSSSGNPSAKEAEKLAGDKQLEQQSRRRRGTHIAIGVDGVTFTNTSKLLMRQANGKGKLDSKGIPEERVQEETKEGITNSFLELDSNSEDSICDELPQQEDTRNSLMLLNRSISKTCFSFNAGLCKSAPLHEERSAPLKPLAAAKAVEILIVDDITINRLVLRGMLKNMGYTPREVFNGKEACRMVLTTGIKFSLVLMDVQMPLMDGIEATRKIRKRFSAAELPIVGVTALSSETEVDKCTRAGMNEVKVKPLSLKDIKALVKEYKLQ